MIEAPEAALHVAALPYAVMLLRPGLVVHSVNAATEHLLGQSARMIVDRPVTDVIALSEQRLFAMMEDSEVQISAREIPVRFATGKAGHVHVLVAPVPGWDGWQSLTLIEPGEVQGLAGGHSREDDELVLRAPAILAHEIKNPLAGIRGAAQLIARKLHEGDKSLTRLITDEVDRIAGLVDQMQSLGRRSSDPASPVNPHLALRRARSVLEAAGHDRLTIVEEFDPSLPETLVSSDALVQVLLNLMTNAAEACEATENPRLTLRSRFASGITLRLPGGGKPVALPIELRVSDNGPGVDPALREHIFDPFVSSKTQGQGLGLALVRKLVRDMNGRITCERDDEAGMTHFRVHLPLANPPAARQTWRSLVPSALRKAAS